MSLRLYNSFTYQFPSIKTSKQVLLCSFLLHFRLVTFLFCKSKERERESDSFVIVSLPTAIRSNCQSEFACTCQQTKYKQNMMGGDEMKPFYNTDSGIVSCFDTQLLSLLWFSFSLPQLLELIRPPSSSSSAHFKTLKSTCKYFSLIC